MAGVDKSLLPVEFYSLRMLSLLCAWWGNAEFCCPKHNAPGAHKGKSPRGFFRQVMPNKYFKYVNFEISKSQLF